MKKKIVSALLISAMAVSLVGCGNNGSATNGGSASDAGDAQTADSTQTADNGASEDQGSSATEAYDLEKITMVVNGTLTATLDNGQADFEAQWEEAVGETLGHDIDLEIQQLDHSGYTDAVGRLFASGDYPDVILMSADMYKQYAETGLLWDMTEAFNNADFQSRITYPEVNENLKVNGKLYGFAPAYGNGCVTYVKQSWLDNVGLSIDDIKTYDDYIDMLTKFSTEDPDGNGVDGDTYGVIGCGSNNFGFLSAEAPYINYLPEFWQDAYPALVQDDNGTWIDGFQTDATKAALERIRDAYAAGLIDPETLTAGTKTAREKFFSNEQSGSSGVFTYWAGNWYQTLTNNLISNEVDTDLVQLPPIAEVGAYINREAPVWCIIDDGDGDDSREQAIFDAFMETMLDGGRVQVLWTYGAEGVHWSTAADDGFTTNAGTDNEKVYGPYADGEFHLLQSPSDENTVWSKNAMDPALVIAPLEGDYASFTSTSELAVAGNEFFTSHMKDAPLSPASATYTEQSGTINDAKEKCISSVVVDGVDVETAMQTYVDTVGSIVDECLTELNSAE
jgi:multiple sugar transport system substrate-binding protein/putative aldouronate transport system substrate-binding protein